MSKRFIISESEKKQITSLYFNKGMISELNVPGTGGGVNIPPGSGGGGNTNTPPATADVPKVRNWEVAKNYIMSKPDSETGIWEPNNPMYEFAKYKNSDGYWMEIKSDGGAFEHKDNDIRHDGSWKWDGSEVIFSWMAKKRSTGLDWEAVKKRFLDTKGQDYIDMYNSRTGNNTPNTFTNPEQNRWEKGGYNYAKVSFTDQDNKVQELEIRDNFTWGRYNRTDDDLKRAGKWSWDGTKINFDVEKSGKDTQKLTDDDKDLYTALFINDKIGKRGSRGPAVKELQWMVTPAVSTDYGTGLGCGNDQEKCDGKYGPKTAELVKKFQKDNNAKSDGIFGKETYRAFKFDSHDKGERDID
jgi:hypothetical protein